MRYILTIYPCALAVSKDILSQTFLSNVSISHHVFSFIIILLCFTINFPFQLYKYLVIIILWIIRGREYGGLLGPRDYLFEIFNAKATPSLVCLVERDENDDEFPANIKIACERLFKSHYKFSSGIETFMGYAYFLKNQRKVEDAVQVIGHRTDPAITRDEFIEYVKNDAKPETLFSLSIFDKPINWNSDGKTYAGVVLSYRHALMDGVCLMRLIEKHLFQNVVNEMESYAFNSHQTRSRSVDLTSILNTVHCHKYIFNHRKDDIFISDNGEKSFIIATEESPRCIGMIKKIRNKTGISFNDIVFTGVILSLSKYFNKKNVCVNRMSFLTPCRTISNDLEGLLNGKVVENHCSMLFNAVPIPGYLLPTCERFHIITQALNRFRYSADAETMFIASELLSFPLPLMRCLWNKFLGGSGIFISIMPIFTKAIIDKYPVKDIFAYINNINDARFLFFVLTFENRLQICLISNDHMVDGKNELQKVGDDIFEQIEIMHKELVELKA